MDSGAASTFVKYRWGAPMVTFCFHKLGIIWVALKIRSEEYPLVIKLGNDEGSVLAVFVRSPERKALLDLHKLRVFTT